MNTPKTTHPLRSLRFLTLWTFGVTLAACTSSIGGGNSDNTDPSNAPDAGTFESAGQCPGGDAAFEELMAKVANAAESASAPGVAVAIVCGGKLAHTGAFGQVQQGGADIDENTRFQLASATKMFTAAAALRLANTGTVDLDAAISTYVPNLSFGQITLRQLLSHSAGFPTGFDEYSTDGLVDSLQANSAMSLWAEPGQTWNYSNTGMAVAGAILEVASGRSFSSLVQEEVFVPTGMESASMSVDAVLAGGNYALGHEGTAASHTTVTPDGSYFASGQYGPMGGAWGSVTDLARWAEAHIAGDVLGDGLMAKLQTPEIRTTSSGQSYGLGHFIADSSPKVVFHGGSTVGFLTDFSVYPEEGFAAIVLTNSIWLNPSDIAQMASDAYLGTIELPSPPADALASQLIGSYSSAVFGTVTITESSQGLQAQFVDKGITSELQHWWGDNYGVDYGSEGEIDFSFWREDGQNASHIVSAYGVAKRM